MKKSNTLFSIYAAGVMLLLLYSMHIYFLWWMYDSLTYQFLADFAVAAIGLIYISRNKIPLRFSLKVILSFLLVWIVAAWNPLGSTTIVYNCPLSLLVLLLLNKSTLKRLLNVWTLLYAIILAVSLVAWPLALAGILPSIGNINFANVDAYNYNNYIFCLVNINLWSWNFVRYSSVFLEPGHISMIGAFTLYLNHYDFRKWTSWAILIASLFSFSLAGYLLLAIGYLLIGIQKSSFTKSFQALLGAAILLSVVYFVSVSYNGGRNLVNTLIIERLDYDEEKGVVGNNRTIGDTDNLFESFIISPDAFVGLDRNTFNSWLEDESIGGAGYKLFIFEKGILGTLVILIAYLFISSLALDKRFIRYFLLLCIIAFLQRSWPATHIWLFLFIFATAVEQMNDNSRKFKHLLK